MCCIGIIDVLHFDSFEILIYTFFSSLTIYLVSDTYAFHALPPLSTSTPWGIFNPQSTGQAPFGLFSQNMYFSPNNHQGVQQLIASLTAKYPAIVAIGCTDYNDMLSKFEANLFNTWAYMEFNLNEEQIATGKLIPNFKNQTAVDYTIMVSRRTEFH